MDKTNQNQTEKKNAGAAKRMAGKRSPGRSREPKWDKLDNTAHLFPVIAGDDMTNVYRISVVLEIADLNGLQVGDVLEFNNWKERETSTVYKAEVVGIYDSISGITPIMYGDSYRSENIIFTDLSFPEKPGRS